MTLASLPLHFEKWVKDQQLNFDTVPQSLKLVMIKRYRDEMWHRIKTLMQDREDILSAISSEESVDIKFLF